MAAKRKTATAAAKSYTIDDVWLTVDGDRQTLTYWLGHDTTGATTKADDADGNDFEFDDPTGRPADVLVYTNGRPTT